MKTQIKDSRGNLIQIKNNIPSKTKKNGMWDNVNLNNTNLNGVFPQVQGISKNQEVVLRAAANPLLISNQKTLLSYFYKNVGVVAAMIDAPVDDAFRGGIIVSADDAEYGDGKIKDIQKELQYQAVMQTYNQAEKWARLFGGAGIIIEVIKANGDPEDPRLEFKVDNLKKGDKVNFYAADLWELNTVSVSKYGEDKPYIEDDTNPCPYTYWGVKLHKTRVIKVFGKEAPSMIRLQLRGWGMSLLENMIDPIANYYELNNLTSNYIDQAKIDVFKFAGMNDAMAMDGPEGMNTLYAKAATANMLKGINNGMAIDTEDDYVQKQTSFAGLPELREQNRIELGASTRMPLTKTYGISSPSFNNGEDGQENYIGMIESTIRTPSVFNLIEIVKILFQVKFGSYPVGLDVKFHPLRILGSKEEQDLKSTKLDGYIRMYDRGLIGKDTFIELSNASGLTPFPLDPKAKVDLAEPPPQKPTLDLYGDDSRERNKLGK
ncbi:MAG: anti-CBASS protein Acb1 family protein [Flavobacterium sp.]